MTVSPEKIAEMLAATSPADLLDQYDHLAHDMIGALVNAYTWAKLGPPAGQSMRNQEEVMEALVWRWDALKKPKFDAVTTLRSQLSGITEETSSDLVPVGFFWRWASDDKWRMLGKLSEDALADFVRDQEKIAPVVVAPLYDPTTIERLTAERDEEFARAERFAAQVIQQNKRAEAAESLNARQAEALKGLVLLLDLFEASERTHKDAFFILAQQPTTWERARALATENCNG